MAGMYRSGDKTIFVLGGMRVVVRSIDGQRFHELRKWKVTPNMALRFLLEDAGIKKK